MSRRLCRASVALAAWLGLAPVAAAHGSGSASQPTDPLGIAFAWRLDLPIIVGLVLASVGYVAAARAVDRAHPGNPWSRARTASFVAGLVAIGLALVSPIDALSETLLTVHMVQHLLLTAVAPPLLAASGIATLALRSVSNGSRDRFLLPILHGRVVAVLTFPLVGWLGFPLAMWASHVSGLYNLALLDDGVHAVEHLLYLGAALLFWWPMFSPDPLRWRLHPAVRLFGLVMQMPPMSFLAITIVSAPAPLYSAYLGRPDAFGVDALTDQRIAGSLMWLTNDVAFLVAAAFLIAIWLRHEAAETRRIDARLARSRRDEQARREI